MWLLKHKVMILRRQGKCLNPATRNDLTQVPMLASRVDMQGILTPDATGVRRLRNVSARRTRSGVISQTWTSIRGPSWRMLSNRF